MVDAVTPAPAAPTKGGEWVGGTAHAGRRGHIDLGKHMTHIATYTRRDGTVWVDHWAEEVNGTVVGTYTFPYEFWTRDGKRRIAKGAFENDDAAVTWFRVAHPEEFKAGVEMRCFDQP